MKRKCVMCGCVVEDDETQYTLPNNGAVCMNCAMDDYLKQQRSARRLFGRGDHPAHADVYYIRIEYPNTFQRDCMCGALDAFLNALASLWTGQYRNVHASKRNNISVRHYPDVSDQ